MSETNWPQIPLKPGEKVPLTRHGVKDASADPAVIADWAARWPGCNWGIATGGPILVVDIDPRHDGDKSLAALPAMPETVECRTGGGGTHYYFKNPGGIGNRSNVRPGIDIRSDGGYVVAPPSVTAAAYEWVRGPEHELADVPDWLLALIKPPEATKSVATLGDSEAALASMRKIKISDKGDGSKRLFAYACRAREYNLSAEQFIAVVRLLITERPFAKQWSNDEITRRWIDAAKRV